jgi:hypothetical protein
MRTKFEPINPAAPVTRIDLMICRVGTAHLDFGRRAMPTLHAFNQFNVIPERIAEMKPLVVWDFRLLGDFAAHLKDSFPPGEPPPLLAEPRALADLDVQPPPLLPLKADEPLLFSCPP